MLAIWSLIPLPFLKTSLNIWKFMVHVLLKPGLENFERYFTSVWDGCNCAVVWTFFGIAFLWDWNENWPFPVLWPLLSFPNLLAYWVQHFHSLQIPNFRETQPMEVWGETVTQSGPQQPMQSERWYRGGVEGPTDPGLIPALSQAMPWYPHLKWSSLWCYNSKITWKIFLAMMTLQRNINAMTALYLTFQRLWIKESNLEIFPKKWKVKVLVTQICLTLCNPMDCSLPGSSAHGILQARI